MSQLPNQNDTAEHDDNRPLTLEEQRARLRQLIIMGKERGYITYAEINDALPDDMSDADQIDNIVTMISGLGIQVTEHTPDAEDILMGDNTANMTDDDAVAEAEAPIPSSAAPPTPCACICAKWVRLICSPAKTKSSSPKKSKTR